MLRFLKMVLYADYHFMKGMETNTFYMILMPKKP